MNHQEEARINKGRLENMQRMKELNPTLPWNCFSAAAHQLAKNDPLQAMQVMFPGMPVIQRILSWHQITFSS